MLAAQAKSKKVAQRTAAAPATESVASKLQIISVDEAPKTRLLGAIMLRQILLSYQSNQRRSTASTKTRGMVSGGGRKPWRQKGTGRARVGSSRNPIWRGGGAAFGPSTARNFQQLIPIRLRQQALATVLSLKAQAGRLKQANLDNPIVKVSDLKKQLPELLNIRKALLIIPDATWARGVANLPNLWPVTVARVNPLDIASAHTVIFVNNTYSQIKDRLQCR
ncbi:MAG: 50S ribosomal protein L4 [bacterium]